MSVKQSASKEEFLKTLNLNMNIPEDKWKLCVMWGEVTTYWVNHFETSSRTILKPEYATNPAVHRPYKWAHLDPATIDSAIADIWANGAPWPKHFYDKGYSEDRRVYNWVLKWLLWHVCRYRDWRNRKSKSSSVSSSGNSGSGSGSEAGTLPPHDFWTTVMN